MITPRNVCEKAIKLSTADQSEAFCIDAKMRNIYVENGEIKLITDNSWLGLGVKSIIDNRIGYYSATVKDEEDTENVVKNSIKIAKISPKDPKFKSLPHPRSMSGSVQDVYDEELVNIEVEEIRERISTLINSAQTNDVRVMTGLLRLIKFNFTVMNSLGVDFSHRGTIVYLHFTAKRGKGEGVVKRFSTKLNQIDFQDAGEELREKTLSASEAEAFRGKEELEVIVEPMELQGLLNVITTASNGEYINRKMSPWIGKLGERVATEALTVIDDGRISGGLRSALADDEGVPTTRKFIIEKGILKSYLFDSYNAGIFGTESTGNGFRRGITSVEESHVRPVNCTASNVIILPGNKSFDTLIEEIDKGVLIRKFAYPQVDPISGNFGLEIRNAVLIKDGSLDRPIKHALLTGNMYMALTRITGIGDKLYNVENFRLPYIRFMGLQLVGM